MGSFTKGPWKEGLFDVKCPLCFFNYLCAQCSIAQIHEKLGNPHCGKPVACILAFLGAGGFQIAYYGHKAKGDAEGMVNVILKTWCCALCYLHQQYKEHGCVEEPMQILMTSFKPSQIEMS